MSDHLDQLLEGGQGNRESVNALMAENQAAWVALNAPCPHEQGQHYLGDAGALIEVHEGELLGPKSNVEKFFDRLNGMRHA